MDIISANGGKLSKFVQNYTDKEYENILPKAAESR